MLAIWCSENPDRAVSCRIYTCHYNMHADDFKKILQQRVVSSVHDYHIYNLAVRYGKTNPHSSIGYYIHPVTARIIVD